MAGVIDKFVFALFLDTKNFKSGADVAERSVNGLRRTILRAYTAIGGIDLFRRMITDYSNTAVELGRLSEVTGESLKELEAWKLTVRDAGSDTSSFFGTLKMLNDEMANIKNYGSSQSLATFQRLGITVYSANGKLKKGTELLKDVAGRLSKFKENSQAFNFGKALGLDEGTIIVLRRYGEGIERVVKQNEKRALISRQDVLNGMAYQKMLSDLKQTFLSLEKAVVPEILKALKEIMPQLQAGLLAVIPLFKGLIPLVSALAQDLASVAKYFEKVGESLAEQAIQRQLLKDGIGSVDKGYQGETGLFPKWIQNTAIPFMMKTPMMAMAGGAVSNIVIEALNINTQATDAQGVAKVTVKAIGDLANQTGH